MSALIKLFGFGVGLYLVILLALYVMQRSIIYHPNLTRPDPAAWGVPDMSAVSLKTTDGLSLLAWWKPPEGNRPVILYFHGNGGHIGFRGNKVRGFLDRGYGVLLVAWRGYSGNQGNPSETGLYKDGEAAIRFLAQQGVEKELVLYGESLGSGVAVEYALRGYGLALVLEAPFTSLVDAAASRYQIFPVRWLLKDRFDSYSKIGKISIPLLIVHGEEDRVLPISFGSALLNKANEPKRGVFIPEAGHNNLYDYGGGEAVLSFLELLSNNTK